VTVPVAALATLATSGLAIGSLYALLVLLAFRISGRAGGVAVSCLARAGWGALLLTDPSGRFRGEPTTLRLAVLPLILAVSILPPLAVHRVRIRHGPERYVRQAVHGLAAFAIAIVGSLVVGLVVLLARKSAGW
jgi:hypothetical protein